jgi:hypothetical protein
MRRSLNVSGSLGAGASTNHDFDFRVYGGRLAFSGVRVNVNVTANDKTGAGSIEIIPLVDVGGTLTAETAVAGSTTIAATTTGLFAAVAEADGAPIVRDGLRVRVTAGSGGAAPMTYQAILVDLATSRKA